MFPEKNNFGLWLFNSTCKYRPFDTTVHKIYTCFFPRAKKYQICNEDKKISVYFYLVNHCLEPLFPKLLLENTLYDSVLQQECKPVITFFLVWRRGKGQGLTCGMSRPQRGQLAWLWNPGGIRSPLGLGADMVSQESSYNMSARNCSCGSWQKEWKCKLWRVWTPPGTFKTQAAFPPWHSLWLLLEVHHQGQAHTA